MIALTSSLLALAGLFAERAVSIARRSATDLELGVRPATRRNVRVPRWAPWCVLGVLALPVTGPAFALASAVVGALGARLVDVRRRRSERRREEDQIADAVAAVAAGIRAGLSLPLAVAHARDEAQPPLERSLARLVARIDVGTPLGQALRAWADELDSDDARLIVGVLDLHHRSGGDLPAVLDGVVGTLRERRAAHREVRALTAQARFSGVILGTLPIGFFAFLLLTSRQEMLGALATPIGRSALALGLVLELVAFLWIRRILEVR